MSLRKVAWMALGFALIFAAVLSFMTLWGCGTGGISSKTGMLTLSFDNEIRPKNIVPDTSMIVSFYDISATGPESGYWERLGVTSGVTVPELVPGLWTITAVAKNDTGVAIGGGQGEVTVIIGTTVSKTISVDEYSGGGTLALNIDWYPPECANPVFESELKDSTGSSTPLTISVDQGAGIGTYSGQHEHGFYSLITRLYDNTVHVGGLATIARIVAGHTSTGTYTILINRATGQMTVDIDDNILDFLHLVPTPAQGDINLFTGQDVTVSFTADDVVGTVVWYVNGIQAQVGGQSFLIDDVAYDVGTNNRVDVCVFNVDGSRAGSLSWMVIKSQYEMSQFRINGSFQKVGGQTTDFQVCLTNLDGVPVTGFSLSFPNSGIADMEIKPFTFPNAVPEGDYLLLVRRPPGEWRPTTGPEPYTVYRFFGQTGVEPQAPVPAVINIPHPLGATYAIGMVSNYYEGAWTDPLPGQP